MMMMMIMMTIEMPAVEQTRSVGPRNRVLNGGAHWRHLASAMRPYYRAMLCIRGTSHGPVSVCLSVRPSVRHKSEFY